MDVDLASRVAVVRQVRRCWRLFEDDEVGRGPLPQLDRGGEAAEPGPDDGYAQRALRTAWTHGTFLMRSVAPVVTLKL